VLEVHDAVVRYGSIEALHGISFSIEQGEIVTLLGANGAGKSTTLRMLSGLRAPVSGTVTFEGNDITQVKAHEFAALGISHVPEGRRIFPVMTVEENLEMGAFARHGSLSDDLEEIYVMFPILKDRRKQLGSNLSGGEQQMLAIGRALMSKPRLLLLDEPSMGLAPMIIDQIFTIIKSIRELGTTIFLVEQNAAQALRLADRGYVMENGRIVFGESADDLLKDPRVRAVYLGETDDAGGVSRAAATPASPRQVLRRTSTRRPGAVSWCRGQCVEQRGRTDAVRGGHEPGQEALRRDQQLLQRGRKRVQHRP
jgi:branched-chain amino acid transport system ATP-binding protein